MTQDGQHIVLSENNASHRVNNSTTTIPDTSDLSSLAAAAETHEGIVSVNWLVCPKELQTTQLYLQCLLLLTPFRFVQLLTRLFNSNLEWPARNIITVDNNHRVILHTILVLYSGGKKSEYPKPNGIWIPNVLSQNLKCKIQDCVKKNGFLNVRPSKI